MDSSTGQVRISIVNNHLTFSPNGEGATVRTTGSGLFNRNVIKITDDNGKQHILNKNDVIKFLNLQIQGKVFGETQPTLRSGFFATNDDKVIRLLNDLKTNVQNGSVQKLKINAPNQSTLQKIAAVFGRKSIPSPTIELTKMKEQNVKQLNQAADDYGKKEGCALKKEICKDWSELLQNSDKSNKQRIKDPMIKAEFILDASKPIEGSKDNREKIIAARKVLLGYEIQKLLDKANIDIVAWYNRNVSDVQSQLDTLKSEIPQESLDQGYQKAVKEELLHYEYGGIYARAQHLLNRTDDYRKEIKSDFSELSIGKLHGIILKLKSLLTWDKAGFIDDLKPFYAEVVKDYNALHEVLSTNERLRFETDLIP